MRCFLMRAGRICGVEILDPGPDDALIRQAQDRFRASPPGMFDSFAVWDKDRPVYHFPVEQEAVSASLNFVRIRNVRISRLQSDPSMAHVRLSADRESGPHMSFVADTTALSEIAVALKQAAEAIRSHAN